MNQFPSSPKPFSCKIGSRSPSMVSRAHNMRKIVSSRGAHRWTFSLTYPAGMSRDEMAPLWAFLAAMSGQLGAFDFLAPNQAARGNFLGAPVVDGDGQSGKNLSLKGFSPSVGGVLKAGDYIRIADDNKSYIVINDVSSDSSGRASLEIYPALQKSPLDEAVVSAEGLFRCALTEDYQELSINDMLFYGLTIDLEEVLY